MFYLKKGLSNYLKVDADTFSVVKELSEATLYNTQEEAERARRSSPSDLRRRFNVVGLYKFEAYINNEQIYEYGIVEVDGCVREELERWKDEIVKTFPDIIKDIKVSWEEYDIRVL